MKSRMVIRAVCAAVGIGVVSGCGGAKRPLDGRYGALYLREAPHRQLYVEIDTLEGTEVPSELIEEIRTFLGRHCAKPGGIRVVRDRPAAFEEELSLGLMALLCTDGPPEDAGEPPAYLHVFFYGTDQEDFFCETENPHVNGYCPTTVFFNVSYCKRYHESLNLNLLRHELGHILGLCSNTGHGNGQHCRHHGCLMRSSMSLLSEVTALVQLPTKAAEPCAACLRDLEAARQFDPNGSLFFEGPFLVERTEESQVMRLPYFKMTWAREEVGRMGWREVLGFAKNKIREDAAQLMEGIRREKHEGTMEAKYVPDGSDATEGE